MSASTAATLLPSPVSAEDAPLLLGGRPVPPPPSLADVTGAFVDLDGERFYRIDQYDALAPFFMTVVSPADHWLFVSSTGGLTAGRGEVERALFPYAPVDRIHDAATSQGGFSVLLVERDGALHLWEPFAPSGRHDYRLSRRLYKSATGHRLCFEEVNHDLGCTFRTEWTTSEAFGFLKRSTLVNDGKAAARVRVLDGLRNLIPAGVPKRLQDSMSCLTDAYKLAERVPGTSLAVYALTSAILDQPVAMESLLATVAWSDGLPGAAVLLTDSQISAFRQGGVPVTEGTARGRRGVYAVASTFALPAGGAQRWVIGADIGLDQVAVARLAARLRAGQCGADAEADAGECGARLRAIVGSADGLQSGGDEMVTTHHFANVLFNVMRGGLPLRGYTIGAADFARFVAERNRAVAETHRAWLAQIPEAIDAEVLGTAVEARDDADLMRLWLEYLPFGFSRRHGDPSRPWNRFSIRLRGPDGQALLEYQGNWRDIFQNWEALGVSFPGYLDHMVAKFVNGSTVDGYNAYRVTRAGVEWEEPAPDDPWATIGYWGDHQVVYLLALLQWADRFEPGRFHAWLERDVFAYTAVPYRIASYDEMRRDPRATIRFLHEEHEAIRAREAREGTDARLVRGPDGRVRHVNLTEKLLLVALVRLANLIPGGGIWMNTQRPEWNDANNALVGHGVSVVTLAQLRRYLDFLRQVLTGLGSGTVRLSEAVAQFAGELTTVLSSVAPSAASVASEPAARRGCVDRLSTAGSRYRECVYGAGLGGTVLLEGAALVRLCDDALALVDASLRAARRPDGLYHAYRLLRFDGETELGLEDLPLMLEGQVAVLGSGLLAPDEALALLRALRTSPLYRPDQHSYILYPDGSPAGFLERNLVPASVLRRVPLLAALVERGDEKLVRRDPEGVLRFHPDLVNETALEARLAVLAADPAWEERAHADAPAVRAVYEEVFRHRSFLGRSGTMFAYEGLGSIYWHMVSKLLVAIQECHAVAQEARHPAARALAEAYFDVRAGLGFNKTPAQYGAYPSDPYSHTPGHAGAQQPGMTGQAKEGVLARWGELGVRVEHGSVRFAPVLLRVGEFATQRRAAPWRDLDGVPGRSAELPGATLAFTFCGTPVVYRLVAPGQAGASVTLATGATVPLAGATLPAELASELFRRTGHVRLIEVAVAADTLSFVDGPESRDAATPVVLA
ncbi:MAG: hypothetical protein IAE82_15245 [Opitutaceae bacterium]|nr:hypothetical protein [Opitutaceae bacterium]